jgi:hypothetical protein
MSAFIGYAKASCTVEDVKLRFEPDYGNVHVEERVKFDARGTPFKIFFLTFTNESVIETLPRMMYGWNVQKSNKVSNAIPKPDDYWLTLADEFK